MKRLGIFFFSLDIGIIIRTIMFIIFTIVFTIINITDITRIIIISVFNFKKSWSMWYNIIIHKTEKTPGKRLISKENWIAIKKTRIPTRCIIIGDTEVNRDSHILAIDCLSISAVVKVLETPASHWRLYGESRTAFGLTEYVRSHWTFEYQFFTAVSNAFLLKLWGTYICFTSYIQFLFVDVISTGSMYSG